MKLVSLLFFIVVVCINCTNVVDIDISLQKPIITVNSLFSADSTWQVSVTRSHNILENSNGNYFFPVDNAVVTIYDENNLLVETLTYSLDNLFRYRYHGNTLPTSGKEYSIRVEIDDEITILAIDNAPIPVPISSVEIDSSRFETDGGDIDLSLTFSDEAGMKNFYCVKILRDAYYMSNQDTIRFIEDVHYDPIDPAFQNDFADGFTTLINDNLFDGTSYEFRLRMRSSFNVGTTENIRVALLSVSEEYYQYFTTKNLQSNSSEDPFAQPTQVFSNIQNGIGIFAGYSTATVKL